MIIWAGESATPVRVDQVAGPGETGAAGWTLANELLAKPQGQAHTRWSPLPTTWPLKMQVEGATNPEVLVSISDVTVTEGTHKAANFVVSLDRATNGPVTMTYETSHGTAKTTGGFDYFDQDGTLTFMPGETEKTVSVPINDDAIAESDETFDLVLSNLKGATFADNQATATIVNAAPLAVSINDASAVEGVDETIDFTVRLNRRTVRPVTINVLFSSGTADFSDITQPDDTSVTFQPGERRKTYSLGIVDDGENEPSETFQLVLQYSGLPDDINVGSPGNGTITNTETLEASFENMPASHDGSNFSFNLAFTAEVGISVQHMRDWAFTMVNGTMTRAQRVDGRYDYWKLTVDPEGNNDVTITVKGGRKCGFVGSICTKEEHPAKLTNSPSATIVYSTDDTTGTSTPSVSIAGGSGTEGTDTSIGFTVTLDEAATDTVTVDYATSDGTADAGDDYTAKSGTLSFAAGETSKTVSVAIADDTEDESDETFTVALSNASGADLGTATATGTIRNRTVVVETTPTVSIAGGSGKEGDDDEIDFTVTLDEAASGTVTVDYTTSDGTADAGDDYTAKSGTLSFSAGTTSKTLSVGIEDDIENESDETFTVTLSNPSGADLGTATATGTIRNRKVEPLTARFEGMPSEHDGSEFTFELHFSENVKTGFAKMRDRAFTLDEADIVTAKRKNPQSADKNKSWTITVKPDGDDRISITLPAAASCTDNTSICTHDDRKVSHSTSATVDGPVGISVGDVEVTEGADAVLVFAVSLTRAAGSALTVDYATSGRHGDRGVGLHVGVRDADDRRWQLERQHRGVGHRRRAQRGVRRRSRSRCRTRRAAT